MEWVEGDISDYAFDDLSEEEKRCAGMCESMVVYDDELGSFEDKTYLTQYRKSLGDKRVEEIYNTIKKFIEEKCQIVKGTMTDNEGVTYNGVAWR